MRIFPGLLTVFFLIATAVNAQGWVEPARGSKDRNDLLSAVRPHAEWMLDAPIEFVVGELRLAGDLAFASLEPQRPGGGQIDISQTPMVLRDDWDVNFLDGVAMQVLFRKSGDVWVAVHWEIGATDVWFAWEPICREYRAVIADFCR